MYNEEPDYDAYYGDQIDAYFAMLDELGKAATPKYTFVAPHGAMCYQEYLAYCSYQNSLEDQVCDELPF